MEGVDIKSLDKISENDKASTFRIDLNGQLEGIVGYRKAGCVFGGHYHEGKSDSKDPEKLALLEGVLTISLKNIKTSEKMVLSIKAPSYISLAPFIWHKLEAITDVVFVEMNSLEDHVADTKYENEL